MGTVSCSDLYFKLFQIDLKLCPVYPALFSFHIIYVYKVNFNIRASYFSDKDLQYINLALFVKELKSQILKKHCPGDFQVRSLLMLIKTSLHILEYFT